MTGSAKGDVRELGFVRSTFRLSAVENTGTVDSGAGAGGEVEGC